MSTSPRNPNLDATVAANPEAAAKPSASLDATMVNAGADTPAEAFDSTQVEDAGPARKPTAAVEATQVDGAAPPKKNLSSSGVPEQLGDFKIKKLLGKGGMGEVYLAHQVSLARDVALKVMAPQFCQNETFAKRFVREAQTMAKLDHPNIVRGYAVGEQEGRLFLAMELIKGRSMQDWMDDLKRLEVGDALHVILLVSDALKHAHEINLVHRDIKPDNILVTEKGIVKVSDLGLAKATDEDMSMTQSGTGLGTPYYMPPEQAANAKHVDQRSDIYALGCTLYYFLTGKLPFNGSSAMELIMAKQKGTFQRARSHNPEIPERLDLLIDKMIAKDPKARYQTCDELIKDLSAVAGASPMLTFVKLPAGASAPSVRLPAAATAVGGTMVTPPAAKSAAGKSGPVTSKEVAASKEAVNDNHVWYVLQTGADGVPKKVKMTTGQIKAQLITGKLDGKVKVCQDPKGKYVPAVSVREFERALSERVASVKADAKAAHYQQLYKDVEKAEKWYKWKKFFRGYVENVKGFISLAIYLGVLIGIGWGIWYFWHPMVFFIKQKLGIG